MPGKITPWFFTFKLFDGLEEDILRIRRCPSKSSSSAKTARVPFDGEFTRELPIPQFIDDCNHFMGGVDIGDQLRSSYNWDRRTRRGGWRAVAFLFLLEVCITNSWQLWRRQEGRKESRLDFRRMLYRDFFLKFSRMSILKRSQPVSLTSQPSLVARHSKIRRPKRGWCAFCSSSKKRAILTVEYVHGQGQRKSNVFFGCEQCNVQLCKDGDCWESVAQVVQRSRKLRNRRFDWLIPLSR